MDFSFGLGLDLRERRGVCRGIRKTLRTRREGRVVVRKNIVVEVRMAETNKSRRKRPENGTEYSRDQSIQCLRFVGVWGENQEQRLNDWTVPN